MGSGSVRSVSQLYSVLAQLTEPGIAATWGYVHGRYYPYWYPPNPLFHLILDTIHGPPSTTDDPM